MVVHIGQKKLLGELELALQILSMFLKGSFDGLVKVFGQTFCFLLKSGVCERHHSSAAEGDRG